MEIRPKKRTEGNHLSKRNRDLLSCTECHKRKKKCNRMLPCSDCSQRGVPQKCAYKPQVSAQELSKAYLSTPNRRWNRRARDTEFLFSAESVADLIGGSDPFNSLPGGLDDETHLVHYCEPIQFLTDIKPVYSMDSIALIHEPDNTQFVNTRHAPGPRKLWFPLALEDPAFYHAIMMISAGNIAGLQDKPPPPSFWYHRGEAIRQINTRIVQIDLANADLSIAAIAVLCIADCLEVVKTGVCAHQKGLQRLVLARGGLDKLGTIIQKLLGWTDLLVSMALVEPPVLQHDRLRTLNYYAYYGSPSFSTISYATDLKARLLRFTNDLESSDDVARIFWGLRNISMMSTTATSTDSLSGLCFSDRCELLERAVQELLHRSLRESSRESDKRSLIFTLFARTCLIYIYSVLRELLMNAKIFQEVGHRLEESMDIGDYDLNVLLSTFPDLMLWVLFLGGSVVVSSRRVWFSKTATIAQRAWKTDDNMVVDAATAFLWPEGIKNYNDSASHDITSDGLSSPESWDVPLS